MDSHPALLALRLAGQDYALEPGREYLLGSGAGCDLRVGAGAAAQHARMAASVAGVELIHLGGDTGTFRNGERIERALLLAGDVLRFGDGGGEAIVVRDDGHALIVPVPAMRTAAVERKVRTAARALRRATAASLQGALASEMRRSPWLLLSLATHVLLLVAAWWLSPMSRFEPAAHPSVTVDIGGAAIGRDPATEPAPGVVREQPDAPIEPVEPDAAQPEAHEAREQRDATGDPAPDWNASALRENPRIAARPRAKDDGRERGPGDRSGGGGIDAIGSGAFRAVVSDLRATGLEIVFVFDSTGSMTRTIADTKSSIAEMLGVLQALVPDARVGLVTYRDHGRAEQYVVRQVPLGGDFWRLANFMQTVTADGGGDLPEAVRAGLSAAFEQSWRAGARRVVVLAGDAPPHGDDHKKLLNDVRGFARNGRSFVHTLLTCDESRRDANESFEAIAAAGKGICERIEKRERVLQRVLTLAFGREFDRDVADVVDAIDEEARRIDVKALDLARRGGPELAAELCRPPVPRALWNALVRRPNRAVVQQLVGLLGAPGTPDASRHAIAAVLQRVLQWPVPPIDPERGTVPPQAELDRLRRAAANVPE